MSDRTYKILQHFPVHVKGMKLCFVVMYTSTMGRLHVYIAKVSWSDLFFFCEIDEQFVICCMGHRDILHAMFFFLITKWISVKATSGYIALQLYYVMTITQIFLSYMFGQQKGKWHENVNGITLIYKSWLKILIIHKNTCILMQRWHQHYVVVVFCYLYFTYKFVNIMTSFRSNYYTTNELDPMKW